MPRLGLAILLLAAIAAGVGYRLWQAGTAPDGPGAAMGPGPVGGPFRLIDHRGRIRTEDDFAGRYTLIFFGYTYCPDVCPTALSRMAGALDRLGPRADRIQPVFISIDPRRDRPQRLEAFVRSFHPRLIGLTGSGPQVARVARAYRVYYQVAESTAGDDHYLVNHTARIYLMGPDGRFITAFGHRTGAEEIARTLGRLLRQEPRRGGILTHERPRRPQPASAPS